MNFKKEYLTPRDKIKAFFVEEAWHHINKAPFDTS